MNSKIGPTPPNAPDVGTHLKDKSLNDESQGKQKRQKEQKGNGEWGVGNRDGKTISYSRLPTPYSEGDSFPKPPAQLPQRSIHSAIGRDAVAATGGADPAGRGLR